MAVNFRHRSTLEDMGFPTQDVIYALAKFSDNLERAADFLLSGGTAADMDESNMQLVPTKVSFNDSDANPPAPPGSPILGQSPVAIPYTSPASPDVVEIRDGEFVSEGEAFRDAAPSAPKIPQSSAFEPPSYDSIPFYNGGYEPPNTPTDHEKAQLDQAFKASLMDLENRDTKTPEWDHDSEDQTLKQQQEQEIETIRNAVKMHLNRQEVYGDQHKFPPMLRHDSMFYTPLIAYFNALFAVPEWRAALLGFRLWSMDSRNPDQGTLKSCSYSGYWSGGGTLFYAPKQSNPEDLIQLDEELVQWPWFYAAGLTQLTREMKEKYRRILVLQSFLTFYLHTERPVINPVELFNSLSIRTDNWMPGARMNDPEITRKLTTLHTEIIHDMNACDINEARNQFISGFLTEEQLREREFHIYTRFMGLQVSLGPTISDPGNVEFKILNLRIPSVSPNQTWPPTSMPTLYEAVDTALVSTVVPQNFPEADTLYPFLPYLPSTLSLWTTRSDSFQNKESTTDPTGILRGFLKEENVKENNFTNVFSFEPTIWLDRYDFSKKEHIQQARKHIQSLLQEKELIHQSLKELLITKDNKEALQHLNATLQYFETITFEDPTKQARQDKFAQGYRKLKLKLEEKLESLKQQSLDLQNGISSTFNSPHFQSESYQLSSMIYRNGLNGRGSYFSYIQYGDSWWRVDDNDIAPVTLEEAFADKTGCILNSGVLTAFYQRKTPRNLGSSDAPWYFRNAVDDDNVTFRVEVAKYMPGAEISPALSDDEDQLETLALSDFSEDGSSIKSMNIPIIKTGKLVDLSRPESEEVLRLRGGSVDLQDDEDSDDEDDVIDEDEVELGYLTPFDSTWDLDLAVGKVGGLPVWLDPYSPLSREDVACGSCATPMMLLLQLNSPDTDHDYAAARSIYVFACRRKACRSSQNLNTWKVMRNQTISPNAFFPATEENRALKHTIFSQLDPQTNLSDVGPAGQVDSKPFPQWAIQSEEEPYEESYLPAAKPFVENDNNADDLAEPETKSSVDREFLVFQERIQRFPKQVLRFYRIPEVEEPTPLWVSSSKISASDVPACNLCGGARAIEFQILSTLVPKLDDEDFSFDTLLVYTCQMNCEIPSRGKTTEGHPKSGWCEEYIVEQNFASDGVRFGA